MPNDNQPKYPGEENYYGQGPQTGQAGWTPPQNFGTGPQGGKLPGQPPKRPNTMTIVVLVLVAFVIILGATTFLALRRISAPSVSVGPTATPAPIATSTTGGVAPSTPTSSSGPTAQPVATVASGTITENLQLTCGPNCNDPIHVTLTTIQIDTANGRMIWDNTLKDVTGSFSDYNFSEYNLQASDSQTPIQAVLSQPQQSGSNQYDVQAIFAFVPIQHVTYTLFAVVVTVNPSDDVVSGTTTFDPVKITF